MNIKLKLLTPDHTNAYRKLRLKSFRDDPYAFSESYEDEKNRSTQSFEQELLIKGTPPEQFVLGAFGQTEQLLGFVKFRRDKRTKARHKSMIHAMYVSPEFRHLGLGQQILTTLIEKAKAMPGLEQIHLWVLHSSESRSASTFYSAFGFESQGTKVKKDLKIGAEYIDAEYMVLYLE